MSGFNWGLTPSGKDPQRPEEPENAEEPEKDDPFAIFAAPAEPDLPPTEAMPTSEEPYRPAPAAPVEPPAEPFVFPAQPPFVQQQPIPPTPPSWQTPAAAPPPASSSQGPPFPSTAAYRPPLFRPPSQYPPAAVPPASTSASPTPAGLATSATPGIDEIFGASAFREYDDAPLLAQLPLRRDPDAPREPRAPLTQGQRILIGVAAGLVAALVLVLVFVLGTNLPALVPASAAQPTTSASAPRPAKTVAPTTGTLAPGVHAWNALNGGECISAFDSAWETEYTVVDCGQGHAAQLVAKGTFADATFPGVDKLASEAKAACVSSKVIDYDAASAYDDLQLSTSYATTQAEWDSGFTGYYCFVNRPDRQIDGNLAKGA